MSRTNYPKGHYDILYFRFVETDESTMGWFMITGTDIKGYFLEPPGPSTIEARQNRRIPPGRYNLRMHSGTIHKRVFLVHNQGVSPSRVVLIHTGTEPKHTRGCFLAGTSALPDSVANPKAMMKILRNFVEKVGVQNVQLVIDDSDLQSLDQFLAD